MGITQEPSTRKHYLVFYREIQDVLNFIGRTFSGAMSFQYADFKDIEEIGAYRYGTVCKAKYKFGVFALKRFKNFNLMPELFINEVRIHYKL